ncbi:HK97 family phage prohead protease [Bacillus sp. JJ864]|uniref:HK97 family phage prohead protease n=1 Tax=Bacillus sp. JJ864 TaxID=3122975 RepID=UPI002FFDE8C2
MSKHNKTIDFTVKQIGSEQERILRFIGSCEHADRDGDVILASGWELDNYKKNPVFLWAHDYSKPPIGRAINVFREADKLIFDIEFPEKEIYEFADQVYDLYKRGFINATSVGFIGKEGEPLPTGGTKFTRQELLELSAVPVPSNPMALQQAKSLGLMSNGIAKYFEINEDEPYIEIEDNDCIEIVECKYIDINCSTEELKGIVEAAVQNSIRGGKQ